MQIFIIFLHLCFFVLKYLCNFALKFNIKIMATRKNSPKRPIGMTDSEYVNEVIMKRNKNFAMNWHEVRGDEMIFKPIQLINSISEKEQSLFANKYMISKNGTVIQIEKGCAKLKAPYWNQHCGMFKLSMTITENGHKMSKCNAVHNLLRNTWGEDVAEDFITHEEEIKNLL